MTIFTEFSLVTEERIFWLGIGWNRSTFISRRAIHNQRIERFWLNLRLGMIDWILFKFATIKNDGVLDITVPEHFAALQ